MYAGGSHMNYQQMICRFLIYGVFMFGVMGYFPTKINAQADTIMSLKAAHDMSLFYWLITIIGGIIAITLTYVSYRKYKGEQQKKRKEKGPDN